MAQPHIAPHVLVDNAARPQLELIAELAVASTELEIDALVAMSLERACRASGAVAGRVTFIDGRPHCYRWPAPADDGARVDRDGGDGDARPEAGARPLDVPVLAKDATMTLYFAPDAEPNETTRQALEAVGRVLGRAIERERSAELARELDAEQRARRAQQAMRRRFVTIVESITDAFFALDERWAFSYLNHGAETMLGLSRHRVLGRTIWSVLSTRVTAQLRPAVELAVERGEAGELELDVDGRRWLHVRIFPIDPDNVPDDAPDYLVSVYAHDISAHRLYEENLARTNEELRHRNAELDQFAYVASHDLKAPLRGINNLATWISEDAADTLSESARADLDLLRGRVQRLENMIDALLTYARAGRTSDEPERVDLTQLVCEIADMHANGRDVQVSVSAEPLVLDTERVPLAQVLRNLLSNAIKHGGAGAGGCKRIEVGWQTHDSGLPCIYVRDNGSGIDARYHQRIFHMFKTLEPRDKVEGTGIGLALVRKLVEARGGEAWVESAEGEGATFYFTWKP